MKTKLNLNVYIDLDNEIYNVELISNYDGHKDIIQKHIPEYLFELYLSCDNKKSQDKVKEILYKYIQYKKIAYMI